MTTIEFIQNICILAALSATAVGLSHLKRALLRYSAKLCAK